MDSFPPGLGSPDLSSDTISWYGPLGFLLVVGLGAAGIVLGSARSLSSLALVLAAAPLAWLALLSLSLGYDLTQGRFFMFPFALSASLWGFVLRIDRYAIAAVAIASATAAFSLVNFDEKPSGIRLLERDVLPAVWGAERWEAQSSPAPRMRNALRFLAELPPAANVALAIGFNDFGYPAFGPGLERHIDLTPVGSGARAPGAQWLLANPDRAPEIDRRCWRVVSTTPDGLGWVSATGWRVRRLTAFDRLPQNARRWAGDARTRPALKTSAEPLSTHSPSPSTSMERHEWDPRPHRESLILRECVRCPQGAR